MLKISLSVLALGAALASSVVYANDTLVEANNQFGLQAGAQIFGYEEHTEDNSKPNGIFDSENGRQATAGAFISHEGDLGPFSNLFEKLTGTLASGKNHYQGGLYNSDGTTSPFAGSFVTHTADATVKIGQGLSFASNSIWQVIPYVGYTYHTWLRAIPDNQENYYHNAAGPGFIGQLAISDLVLSLDLQHSWMFRAKQDAAIALAPIRLGNGQTSTGILGADYAVGVHSHLLFSYEANFFRYGVSSYVGSVFVAEVKDGVPYVLEVNEPSSKTLQQTIFLGYGYSY